MRCTHAEGAAMAEYIEREAAIRVMEQMDDIVLGVEAMYDIPAADVVEVVRCKDCKHYHAVITNEKTGELGDWGICDQPWRNEGYDVNETDYCSSAELK